MNSSDTHAAAPALSLVVTTLGRTAQVERLFHSLARQSFTDFDVVVVDQNDDDRLAPLCAQPWPFAVQRLHRPGERGASRGRNRGWRACRGRILLFPDDDSWYAPRFLEQALATMRQRGCDVLQGRAADESGRTINGRFEATAQRTDRRNVWTTAIEWMVFFRREVLVAVEGFDEDIGVGASTPWQSAEIQDILIRALAAGFTCWFDPDVIGHHEEIVVGKPDARVLHKARGYARGMGFVLSLHGYGPATRAAWIVRPVAGAMVSLARGRWYLLPYHVQAVLGRLEGAVQRTLGKA